MRTRFLSTESRSVARLAQVIQGFTLGVLGGVVAARYNLAAPFPFLESPYFVPMVGVATAALFLTRLRIAVWGVWAAAAALVMLVSYTPVIVGPAHALVRRDPLRHADAVVALSSDVHQDGSMDSSASARLGAALDLLRQGYAPTLVITRITPPERSSLGEAKRQVAMRGLKTPVEEVGPVDNTHDEALRVADLARRRGWKRILLVTSPTHTGRAGAVFGKALAAVGAEVIVRPCVETEYDFWALQKPRHRLLAFRDTFRERLAWIAYRQRGWL